MKERDWRTSTDWIPENVRLPEGCEHETFDLETFPHAKGVLEAWDNSSVREITLCWGTRTGKTTILMSLLIHAMKYRPADMFYGSCDKTSTEVSIKEQLLPMLSRSEATDGMDDHDARSLLGRMKFGRRLYTNSEYPFPLNPVQYLFKSEFSKWPGFFNGASFDECVKDYPDTSKIFRESTPAVLGICPTWKALMDPATDRKRFHVKCPRCGFYQPLDFGDRDSAHGIKWRKLKSGRIDLQLAKATAFYQCADKQCQIENEARAELMQSGVWLSEGQSMSRHGQLIGCRNLKSPRLAFGPLGWEYSLLVPSWGHIAACYLECGYDIWKLRNFYNSSRALAWDPEYMAI